MLFSREAGPCTLPLFRAPSWIIFCFHLYLVKLKFFVLKKANKEIMERSEQNV